MKGNDHPAIHELRELSIWSEGQVWCSPERHGQITGLMKAQIDHLPLALGGVRPTQGRTLAVMQVSGGSQSFNAVNTPARPVDAHGHDPESVERGEGLR
jgi:arsenical resistance protein ArsH